MKRTFASTLVILALTSGHAAGQYLKPINVEVPDIAGDKAVKWDYDIVYVRVPRVGGKTHPLFAEVFHPAAMDPGGDLMLLHPDGSEELLVAAGASPLTAPFTPFHFGARDVPPEFKRHRYLTAGEADRFQDPDHQGLESTRFAFRTYKRLFYLTKEHEKKFLPEVTETLEAFEAKLIARQSTVERTADKLFAADESELAREYLTYYSNTEAMSGMRLADDLAVGIEARTRALYGIRQPK